MSKEIAQAISKQKRVYHTYKTVGHTYKTIYHTYTVKHQLLWCGLILCMTSPAAISAIYKTTNELGYPVYSDQPSAQNKPVKLDKIQTIQTKTPKISTAGKSNSGPKTENSAQYYKQITIGFPLKNAVFENGPATVTFVVNISPNLMGQHYVQLRKNGQVVSGPKGSMNLTVTGLERGEHHIVPEIVDETGKLVISGEGITIHVKQPSALHPNRAKPVSSAPK